MHKELCERLVKRKDLNKEQFKSQLVKLVSADRLTESEMEGFLSQLEEEE